MVYLVRHADAGDKAAWRDVDLRRPLSPQGLREAAGLVIRLDDFPIDRILSSSALRCAQTMGPIARQRRLAVEHSDLLEVDADAARLAAFVGSAACDKAVLCTHGEVLEKLFPILITRGATVTDPLVWPKGATWILHRSGDGPLRGTFLPALAWPVVWSQQSADFWGPPLPSPGTSERRRRRRTGGRQT